VLDGWQRHQARGEPAFQALALAIDEVFNARVGDISGRGKLAADMREIWMMQPRFERRSGNGPFTLVEQPRFRAGFDFLRLRADAGEVDPALARWWEDFSVADEARRRGLMDAVREQQGMRRANPRRKPAQAAAVAGAPPSEGLDPDPGESVLVEGAASAPRKRRRRRRKPAGAAPAAGSSVEC
jgi:poly(A) polymerase